MKYYLAYGSNLNKEQMAHRCPGAKAVGTSTIQDYQLIFRRGYLTIEKAEGKTVPVGIWAITEKDERALDRYEGYPKFYRKEVFPVTIGEKESQALVYIMQDGFVEAAPTDNYFYTVYMGYDDFRMSKKPLVDAYERAKWGKGDERYV